MFSFDKFQRRGSRKKSSLQCNTWATRRVRGFEPLEDRRMLTPTVSTFVSSGLDVPEALAFDAAGNLYVTNHFSNSMISVVTPAGAVSTFVSAGLGGPFGLAFDSHGNLYVANYNTISEVTPAGAVSTFVSKGLDGPTGLAFDAAGNLYVANTEINTISVVTPGGSVFTFAAGGGIDNPTALAFDAAGNLYVGNIGNDIYTISKVTPAGGVSTFVSSGLDLPTGLAIDAAGNLYVANGDNNTISEVTPAGAVSTFVSSGLNFPDGLAFDAAGNLCVANVGSNTISKVTAGPLVVTPANWTSAGLTLTLGGGNLHVYTTGTTTDAVAPCPPAFVTNIEITSPSDTAANLTIDSTAGDPIPSGGLDYSGGGGLIITGSGTVALSGANSYTGGTTVSAGTLLINAASALPDGTSLTVGAGATFVFDPSQSASSAATAGLAVPALGTAAASETSAPIAVASAPANEPVAASVLWTLSPAISATAGNSAETPVKFATSAVTTVGDPVPQVLARPVSSNTYFRTDKWAKAASVPVAKDASAVATPAKISSVASDTVFKSYRSPVDRTISPADNAQSARPWAWLAAIESSWNYSDQDNTTDSTVAALDKVLARFGV